MKTIKEKIEWVLNQHRNTNHKYDGYLPYEYHLKMTVRVLERFSHHVEDISIQDITLACYSHDLIEDTRISYNDVKSILGYNVAELVYALTEEKGKNRKERLSEKYYSGLRDIKYGIFIKLCDVISNVEYCKMSGSSMIEMYRKEFDYFTEQIGYNGNFHYKDMYDYLKSILF